MFKTLNLSFILLCLAPPLNSEELNRSWRFGIDNDSIVGKDQHYTNGLVLSYSKELEKRGGILNFIPGEHFSDSSTTSVKWGVDIAQKIWSPEDITVENPSSTPTVRPYTGFLYAEGSLIAFTKRNTHRYGLMLGTTGERSFAEEGQTFIHQLIGSPEPRGWRYQIDNQVILNTRYDWHHKLLSSDPLFENQQELTTINRFTAGNFRSEVASGFVWRRGSNLSDSLGAVKAHEQDTVDPAMIKQEKSGQFIFAGLETRYRFNDITIEGDRPTPAIGDFELDITHIQASAVFGGVIYNSGWGTSLAFIVKSKEYTEQTATIVGSGSLNFFYLF